MKGKVTEKEKENFSEYVCKAEKARDPYFLPHDPFSERGSKLVRPIIVVESCQ